MQDFEVFFKENSKAIFRYFYYKGLSKNVSEDLSSESFFRLYKNFRDTYNKQILWGIAKNVYREHIRELVSKNEVDGFDEELFLQNDEYYDEEFENKIEDMKKEVIELIEKLNSSVKKVIKLRYLDNLSVKKISEKENMPISTVKKYQQRGIKYLQELKNKYKLVEVTK